MKTKTIISTLLAMGLMACANDPGPQTPEPQEIHLSTLVSGGTRAVDDATALQEVQLANGTTVSVKVKENAPTPTIEYRLALYTADGLGGLALPAGEKQYFPASGNSVDIYAFHPAGSPSTYAVQTDQSTADGYKASDLMWASLTGLTSSNTPEQCVLNFRHKLSKISVQLVKGDFDDDLLAQATVTLGTNDLVTSGTFTQATGAFESDDSGTGTITMATNAGTAKYAAIVVPQSMTGKKINIITDDATRSYTILTPAFLPGKRYTYVLTVDYSGEVSLIKSDITDWEDVEIEQTM